MIMLSIVADDKIPFLKGVFEPYATVQYLPGAAIRPEHVRRADALIVRTRTKCNASLLGGSRVQFVATATIGYDHIDREYLKRAGIRWTNAPGCNAGSVEQYIASVLVHLAYSRNISLQELTLGVVGVGNVGTKVAKIANLLGMQVLLNDPPRARTEGGAGFSSLEEIRKSADIISFHVPLYHSGTDRTLHIADDTFFRTLGKKAFIINTARGPVVDNQALKRALQNNSIAGAVLDVWEHEPEINRELLDAVDIGTPHIAGYSRDGKANGTAAAVHAVSSFLGLGLERWYPEVEKPQHPKIYPDAEGKTDRQLLQEAIAATYNVKEDDEGLHASPETFEYQRGNYPVRREWHAYTVYLPSNRTSARNLLQKAGFNIALQ